VQRCSRTATVTVGLRGAEPHQSVSAATDLGLTPHRVREGIALSFRGFADTIFRRHARHIYTGAVRVGSRQTRMHTHTHTHRQTEAAPVCMPTVTHLSCVNSNPLNWFMQNTQREREREMLPHLKLNMYDTMTQCTSTLSPLSLSLSLAPSLSRSLSLSLLLKCWVYFPRLLLHAIVSFSHLLCIPMRIKLN